MPTQLSQYLLENGRNVSATIRPIPSKINASAALEVAVNDPAMQITGYVAQTFYPTL
jgi:hypothetical protein